MKLLFSFFLSIASFSALAQTTGEISYTETVDLHRRLTGEREQFKEFVPKTRSLKMVLTFDDHQAIYRKSEVQDEVTDGRGMGRRMSMRMMGASGTLWQDYKSGARVEERDFMDKKFLISGEPHTYPWKLTGETMQVGQYLCQQATFEDSARQVVAWFTPTVAVPLGPGQFGQLPGLILHVDINEGERTITAEEINLKEIDSSTISEPKKGKNVTEEEFREIVREKMKEMRASGDGGRMFIRRQRN